MKKFFFLLPVLFLNFIEGYSQSVAINNDGSKANLHAIVDIKSSTKGVLIPRMNTTDRLAIPNTKGLLVYDNDDNLFWYNTGMGWQSFFTTDKLKQNGEAWLLKGNSKTKVNNNFIGTKDNVPLDFRVNNQPAGRLDPVRNNTYWGYLAGVTDSITENNPDGNNRTGATAVGYKALYSNQGNGNTAVGNLALSSNTYGKENTSIGFGAMSANTEGIDNSATGFGTLGQNTTGSFNVADGYFALFNNTTGNTNTAIGNFTLGGNIDGSYNTAIGVNALSGMIEGEQNTALGANAGVSVDGLNNATALGAGATADASNKIRLGNAHVTVIEGQVPFTNPSDGRFKFNIQENVKGLDFILKLRPVTYQFDVKKQEGFTKGLIQPEQLNTYISTAGNDEASQMIRTGFIAQEVEQAAVKTGYQFDGVKAPKTEREYYSLSYSSFVVPLVKAVQEQQEIIQVQNQRIINLEKQLTHNADGKKIEEQKTRIDILELELAEIKKSLQASH